jgi:transposase, IS5 family
MATITGLPQMNMLEPSVNELVRKDHPYRKLVALLDFGKLIVPLSDIRSTLGRQGYALESGFASLLLQWMEDLSDRQMERFLQENNAAKYFCGFTLTGRTPDHSYFGRLRDAIGTTRLAKIFHKVNDELRRHGVVSDIFTFVDASQLISKLTTWDERDKAIKEGEEKLQGKG